MKNIFLVFCALAICMQTSCISNSCEASNNSSLSKNKYHNHTELLEVTNLLLAITPKTAWEMGLLGTGKEYSATNLLKRLKQRNDTRILSLNTCVTSSIVSSSCGENIENLSIKNGIDTNTRFSAQGLWLPAKNLITLTTTFEQKHNPKLPKLKICRINMSSSFYLKDGQTLLHFKAYNNANRDNHSVLLGFVKAKRLTHFHDNTKKRSKKTKKMARITIKTLKISQKLASEWGLDGTPVLNTNKLPGKKEISNYQTLAENKIFLQSLLKEPGTELIKEEMLVAKNKSEVSYRNVREVTNGEYGTVIRLTPIIDNKEKTISFNFSPAWSTLDIVGKHNFITTRSYNNTVILKNNHTLLLRNSITADKQNILLTMISGNIIEVCSHP